MPRSAPSHGRTGRPPVTSRAQILTAARQLIDRDGWEKLTIRRLATELGIGATTLYYHVRDKEDLLIQLLNHYAEQTMRADPSGTPRDRVIAAATAIHDSLAAWPWAAEVLTADGFLGLLGESALRMVEAVIDGAIDHGCTPDQAAQVFRSIWYYTVGEILVRAHSTGRDTGGDSGFLANLDAEQLPRLAALGNRWPTLSARDTYPEGLTAFVDGLLAQATAAGRE